MLLKLVKLIRFYNLFTASLGIFLLFLHFYNKTIHIFTSDLKPKLSIYSLFRP